MGLDAVMVVRLSAPITDADLVDASYRLAEAVGGEQFMLSTNAAIDQDKRQRALNRVTDSYQVPSGCAMSDGEWLDVAFCGRYYGPGYERGNLWIYIQTAEWLLRNFTGCAVYYGGDSGGPNDEWTSTLRDELIAHWAEHGHRPYHQNRWGQRPSVPDPECPLCEKPATQYGSGGQFASWTCDACGRHWVWRGGAIAMFDASDKFDPFTAKIDPTTSPIT